ncbi:hypothetical protein F4824DRAFT_478614 [Ustulina deusta]|nr:hypothetical protein F4824DRAFT_478614 [Ustulina deusta]
MGTGSRKTRNRVRLRLYRGYAAWFFLTLHYCLSRVLWDLSNAWSFPLFPPNQEEPYHTNHITYHTVHSLDLGTGTPPPSLLDLGEAETRKRKKNEKTKFTRKVNK